MQRMEEDKPKWSDLPEPELEYHEPTSGTPQSPQLPPFMPPNLNEDKGSTPQEEINKWIKIYRRKLNN